MATSSMTIVPASNLSTLFAIMLGTGFESLPPLPILYKPFSFLTCVGLETVGLRADCVPFHSGWTLVEWKPTTTGVWDTILDIVEEMTEEEEFIWRESSFDDICEISVEGMSEEEPRTGTEPVRDIVEELFGEEARTGTEPVLDTVMEETETERVFESERTGDIPVREEEMGDSHSENLPSTSEGPREAIPQTAAEPVLETVFGSVPRRSRYKTVARRTRISWRLAAQATRSRAPRQGPPEIEEIRSSSEETTTEPLQTPTEAQRPPVLETQL